MGARETAETAYPIEGASTPGGATIVYAKQEAFVAGAEWALGGVVLPVGAFEAFVDSVDEDIIRNETYELVARLAWDAALEAVRRV